MRFRRRSFRRIPREPLRWQRLQQNVYDTPFLGPGVSLAQLFDPQNIASGSVDEQLLVKRIVLDRPPMLSVPTDVIPIHGLLFLTVYLQWYIFVQEKTNLDIPTDEGALFGRGRDVIQGGMAVYNFQPQAATWAPWHSANSHLGQNWIDTKINRVLNTFDTIKLWCKAISPSQCDQQQQFTFGAETGPCFVHDYNISTLWQRRMRRR